MIITMEIKILNESVKPFYATDGAAAFDLFNAEDDFVLAPNEIRKTLTGISVYIEDRNLCGLIVPRSGLGSRGIILANTVGLIDSDYQGEIIVCLWNRGQDKQIITSKMRIAQMIILPVFHPNFKVVEQFSNETTRGTGGFGSSGA